MRVSAKTDYALRALVVLAERAPALVKLEVLTVEEGLPRKFVESILSELRRAGLVHSRRGSDGGYRLARPADAITVGAVIRVLDGPLTEAPRPHRGGSTDAAPLADVWVAVEASISSVLDTTTLAHLLSGRLPDHVQHLAASPGRTA